MTRRHRAFGLALLVASGVAMAHPGHADLSFASGFAHPLIGFDHLLTMLAVGLYAAQQKGVARWALPMSFVAAMLGGALLGGVGVSLPMVEGGIAASVVVLGVLLALVVRPPLSIAAPLVGILALFHGHAHFVEMGHQAMLAYAAGFLAAAAGLHLAGFALARWIPEGEAGRRVKRVLGGALTGTGLVLLGS